MPAHRAGRSNVYNWDTYIAEDTIDNFTGATSIDVRYDLFASSDELFAKLREGNPGYDVIYPSNDYVERMIVADMLEPLDQARILNMANIDPVFADPSFDPAEIMAPADALIKAKDQIKAFVPDTGQDLLISGEVDACMEWSGDILQVMLEDPELGYSLPSEGGILWEDAMCIPRDAPNPEAAHEWINYILDAKVHASIADYVKYACPISTAMAFIPEEDRNNPAIYPPCEAIESSEVSVYKGEEVESIYEEALTRVLAA